MGAPVQLSGRRRPADAHLPQPRTKPPAPPGGAGADDVPSQVLRRLERMDQRLDQALKPKGNPRRQLERVAAEAKGDDETQRFGFKSFGEYVAAVKQAGLRNGQTDPRLLTKAPSGLNEGTGADGGFLVPPEFSNQVWQRVYENNDLINGTTKWTCSGNTMVFPAIDESSRVDGSRMGGILAYWLDEADQKTPTKPKFRRLTLSLKKVACLAYVTDELLEDSMVALDQWLYRAFADEITFQVGNGIINGSGAGRMQGILNSPALITVSAEPGQGADTIQTENIVKMWARLWAPSQKNAVWLLNQNTFPSLSLMTLGVGTGGVVTYMPPGGLSVGPYATIMGRPAMTTEFNPGIGDVGDILLADLTQYYTLTKGAPETESSIHLRFDYDETVFRVVFRIDGAPIWNTALTPYKGTETQGPFVALAAR